MGRGLRGLLDPVGVLDVGLRAYRERSSRSGRHMEHPTAERGLLTGQRGLAIAVKNAMPAQ